MLKSCNSIIFVVKGIINLVIGVLFRNFFNVHGTLLVSLGLAVRTKVVLKKLEHQIMYIALDFACRLFYIILRDVVYYFV